MSKMKAGIDMSFTHLNVHSGYSLMKSTIKIEDLVKRASELNFDALALTDDEVLHGIVPFYKACIAYGVKPIIGMTIPFIYEDSFIQAIVLAKTNDGYQNLLKLSTSIQAEKERPTVEEFVEVNQGLVIILKTSTGILKQYFKDEDYADVSTVLQMFKQKEDIYLGIESYQSEFQSTLNEHIKNFSENHKDIHTVALSDVRYLAENDVYSYDCLQAMKNGESWEFKKPDRAIQKRHLCPTEEMVKRFSFWPETITTTGEIVNKCNVTIEMNERRLPSFPLPDHTTASAHLGELCNRELPRKFNDVTKQIKERLEHELTIINSLGFSDYFLIVADFVAYAKRNNILVGPGRGSAAGSLVSYVLGITDVDPIKYDLLFERFLNPERVSLPDIDIDFSDVRRDEVIDYVRSKYGNEHVAQIITFGTFGARSLLRELMKTLTIDGRDQAYLLKHIPAQSNRPIITYVNDSKELKKYVKQSKKLRLLFHIAQTLEGLPRHGSTHAAGIVITKEPLVNYVPLTRGSEEFYLTQFAMNELESVGLLKIDLLGLRNLSLIERIIKTIQQTEQKHIDLTRLPVNDPDTFRLLQEGKTNGIFQLESDGMKRLLTQLKPTVFEDIVALNALYRPGPMEQIPTFIARKHGEKTFTYLHPDLEPILKETYGVLVYQEQIMQIAHQLAGFSLGKADILRRAVSKKQLDVMNEQKESFINGCLNNGYDEHIANELFSWIVKFADYGFNKSHSVAYSKIAYQLSYLKAHYPNVFFAELLSTVTNQPEKLSQYIREANDLHIDILPPSINTSFGKFSVEDKAIRVGLLAIKGIGYQIVQEIVRVRKEKPFTDLFDFCLRTSQKVVKRNIIETLILAGAFDETNSNRASLLASIDQALERAELFGSRDGQANLFVGGLDMRPAYIDIEDFKQMKKLSDEKELIGIYVSDHPMKQYRTTLALNQFITINRAKRLGIKRRIKLAAIIQRVKKIRTKRGESMAFITFADETDEMEAVMFPDAYRKANQWLDESILVQGEFTISERNGNKQLIVNELAKFDEETFINAQTEQLFLRFTKENNRDVLKKLRKIVQKYPGNTMIIVYYEEQKKTYQLGNQYLIQTNDVVLNKLKEIYGNENVVLKN